MSRTDVETRPIEAATGARSGGTTETTRGSLLSGMPGDTLVRLAQGVDAETLARFIADTAGQGDGPAAESREEYWDKYPWSDNWRDSHRR